MSVRAVLFDWGGTLSRHVDVDLLQMWRAAAQVPHPEAFRAMLTAVGVGAAEAVFVGDRPRDDVSGAQGVGMRAVLMTGRPVEAWPAVPDAELVTLDGLLELVDAWS